MNAMKTPSDGQVAKSHGQVFVLILFPLHHSLLLDPSVASGSASPLAFFLSPCPHLLGWPHPTFTVGASALLLSTSSPGSSHQWSRGGNALFMLLAPQFLSQARFFSPRLVHSTACSCGFSSLNVSSLTNPKQGII